VRRLARLMNQIAIAAGSGWQVRKANPTSKRPAGCETRVIAKFAGQDSVCAFCEHLSGRPVDHIAPTSEGPSHFLDKQTGAAIPATDTSERSGFDLAHALRVVR
jgi:hypothetical protein